MGVSFVISGLVSKRSELAGLIEQHVREIDRLDALLRHVDATLKLFDPELDLRSLPPKRFREENRIFRQGESSRLILDVLREADGPLNTVVIAQRIAAKKNLDDSQIKSVRDTILDALRRAEKRGLLSHVGRDNTALLWQLI